MHLVLVFLASLGASGPSCDEVVVPPASPHNICLGADPSNPDCYDQAPARAPSPGGQAPGLELRAMLCSASVVAPTSSMSVIPPAPSVPFAPGFAARIERPPRSIA